MISNKKDTQLFKRIRDAFNTTNLVLSWGEKTFGWNSNCNLPGSNTSLLDQVWGPFLKADTPETIRTSLSQWKTVRVWIMKILGSSPEERKNLMSYPPKGTRKWVINFVKKWQSDMSSINRRAWMTIMFSTRSITLEGQPDYLTITQDSNKLTPSYNKYIKKFWKKLRVNNTTSVSRRVRWSNWHLTSKQGPNGLALMTLVKDYMSLPESLKDSLSVLGGSKFDRAMKTLSLVIPWFTGTRISTDKGQIRKVSNFGDLEGKTRVIAVLDYFSQSVLKPLHSWLFKILKRIPQDFTFNQGGFREYIKDWDDFYSCDLSAATDRFPIKVISQVLLGIFPQNYVTAWENIMVGYPFRIPGDSSVSYQRGNPMGAYSSWASFTLAHHFVMFMCCEDLGIKWHTAKYAILGDDVLIGDTNLYLKYRSYLDNLDIPVSEPKTHESKILLEFAKRWVYKGEEITPFPIPAMREAKNYAFLTSLLSQESERGYQCDIPSSVKHWFQLKDEFRREKSGKKNSYKRDSFYTDLATLSLISENLIKMFRRKLPWIDGFKIIYKEVRGELEPHMDDNWINCFWAVLLRDMWLKSSDTHMIGQIKYHENLSTGSDPHLIWNDLMREHFFEIDELTDDGILDVKLVPWVDLAGQLTATSDDSYYTIVQLLKGNLSQLEGWEAVRRLVLPDLGTVFRERKYNVIRVLAGKFSRDLRNILKGDKKLTMLTSQAGMMNFEKSERFKPGSGRELVDPLSPQILSDTWGAVFESEDKK